MLLLFRMLTAMLGWRSVPSIAADAGRHFVRLDPKLIRKRTPSTRLDVLASSSSSSQQQQLQQTQYSSLATSMTPMRVSRPTFVSRRLFFWRADDNDTQTLNELTKLRGGAASESSEATATTSAAATTLDATSKDPSPNKQQQSQHSNPSAYQASACTAQGFRSYMEDEFFISLDADFAGVFDGHGGQAVSRYLRQNLYANLQASLPVAVLTTASSSSTSTPSPSEVPNNSNKTTTTADTTTVQAPPKRTTTTTTTTTVEDYKKAMRAALDKVDREVQRISHWSYQGSTAVAVWIHQEKVVPVEEEEVQPSEDGDHPTTTTTTTTTLRRTIIAANVGDSRAVLCRNHTAWDLTRDHKPNDPHEQERIETLGGKVVWCGDTDKFGDPILEQGIYRVNGNLALSRAIGDRSERPHVTAEPEIITAEVGPEDQFILLASDGLWDVMSSCGAVEYVLELQQDGHTRDKVATLLVEEALRRGTYDNITVVIIWLDQNHRSSSIRHETKESSSI